MVPGVQKLGYFVNRAHVRHIGVALTRDRRHARDPLRIRYDERQRRKDLPRRVLVDLECFRRQLVHVYLRSRCQFPEMMQEPKRHVSILKINSQIDKGASHSIERLREWYSRARVLDHLCEHGKQHLENRPVHRTEQANNDRQGLVGTVVCKQTILPVAIGCPRT